MHAIRADERPCAIGHDALAGDLRKQFGTDFEDQQARSAFVKAVRVRLARGMKNGPATGALPGAGPRAFDIRSAERDGDIGAIVQMEGKDLVGRVHNPNEAEVPHATRLKNRSTKLL